MADFSGQELASFSLEQGVLTPAPAQGLITFDLMQGGHDPYEAQELVTFSLEQGGHDPYAAQELVSQLFSRDPESLALTGDWGDSFSGAPWVGTPSAGTSGSHNLTNVATGPTVGSPLGGLTPASFDALGGYLQYSGSISNLLSTGAWSWWALVYVNSISTDTGLIYNNVGIASEGSSGDWSINLRYNGGSPLVYAYQYDTGLLVDQSVSTPIAIGAWTLVQARYDGTDLWIRTNKGPWSSIPAVPTTFFGTFFVGANYTGAALFDGEIATIGTADVALSDVEFDGLASNILAKYSLSLDQGSVGYSISSEMTGGATLTGNLGIQIDANLSGGATLTETLGYIHQVTASLDGGATFNSEAGVHYVVDATFSGVATQDADVTLILNVDASISGSADLPIADLTALFALDSTFVGDATFDSWIILHTKLGFCFFFGIGDLNGNLGLVSFSWPFCNLYASSELTADAYSALFGTASLSGEGTLLAPVLYNQFEMGSVISAGGDSFLASAVVKLAAVSTLAGEATMAAELLVTLLLDSAMTGAAQVTADAVLAIALDSTMAGEATFTAPRLLGNLTADLVGGATVDAEAIRILNVDAALEGEAEFTIPVMLWYSHPFDPPPLPAQNSGVKLQEFIDALGLTKVVVPPAVQDVTVVTTPRSVLVEPVTIRYGWPFYWFGYYGAYYTTATYNANTIVYRRGSGK